MWALLTAPLTIAAGAEVSLNTQDALGYTAGSQVTTVTINGGVLNNASNNNNGYLTNFILNGGTMTSSGGGRFNFNGGYGVTTNANTATSVISGPIDLRGSPVNFNVTAGSTASGIDLLVTGVISDGNSLVKQGTGLMRLTASNTYSGGTTISGGTLQLGSGTATLGATTGTLAVTNGLVDLNGRSLGVGAVSGSGTINDVAGGGA